MSEPSYQGVKFSFCAIRGGAIRLGTAICLVSFSQQSLIEDK